VSRKRTTEQVRRGIKRGGDRKELLEAQMVWKKGGELKTKGYDGKEAKGLLLKILDRGESQRSCLSKRLPLIIQKKRLEEKNHKHNIFCSSKTQDE